MSDSNGFRDNGVKRKFELDAARPPGMVHSDSPKLMGVADFVKAKLEEIRTPFKGDYRITVILRNTDPHFANGKRDFVVSDDDFADAAAALLREKGGEHSGRFPLKVGEVEYSEHDSGMLFNQFNVHIIANRDRGHIGTAQFLESVRGWMQAAIEKLSL